jgi:hypothetical protein
MRLKVGNLSPVLTPAQIALKITPATQQPRCKALLYRWDHLEIEHSAQLPAEESREFVAGGIWAIRAMVEYALDIKYGRQDQNCAALELLASEPGLRALVPAHMPALGAFVDVTAISICEMALAVFADIVPAWCCRWANWLFRNCRYPNYAISMLSHLKPVSAADTLSLQHVLLQAVANADMRHEMAQQLAITNLTGQLVGFQLVRQLCQLVVADKQVDLIKNRAVVLFSRPADVLHILSRLDQTERVQALQELALLASWSIVEAPLHRQALVRSLCGVLNASQTNCSAITAGAILMLAVCHKTLDSIAIQPGRAEWHKIEAMVGLVSAWHIEVPLLRSYTLDNTALMAAKRRLIVED